MIDVVASWGPVGLALEDGELVPENQKLKSELGLWVTPIDEGIEEQTEEGVEKSKKHGGQSWHDDSPFGPPSDKASGLFLTPHREGGACCDAAGRCATLFPPAVALGCVHHLL